MIVDKIETIGMYNEIKLYKEEIFSFIKRLEEESLPEGKYELDGERLFALVQIYTTKSRNGAYSEAHKKYADLQYIHKGREIIYWNPVTDLNVREDRTPQSDILFYEAHEPMRRDVLEAGMFGYYAPQDAHMPCIMVDQPEAVTKVVFKIRVDDCQ